MKKPELVDMVVRTIQRRKGVENENGGVQGELFRNER